MPRHSHTGYDMTYHTRPRFLHFFVIFVIKDEHFFISNMNKKKGRHIRGIDIKREQGHFIVFFRSFYHAE